MALIEKVNAHLRLVETNKGYIVVTPTDDCVAVIEMNPLICCSDINLYKLSILNQFKEG